MARSRLLWKLYAGYAVLIVICTTVIGGLTAARMEKNTLSDIRHVLEVQAVYLRSMIERSRAGEDGNAFQEMIAPLASKLDTRITIIDADGKVLADSERDPATMDNHGTRPEILAARSHGFGTSTRFSHTLGTDMLYYAMPLGGDGEITGYVRTALPLAEIDEKLSQLRNAVILGVVLTSIAALIIGFLLARHFTRPLTSMVSAASSYARGRYEKKLPVNRNDEIGALARALNRMADKSRERMEMLATDRNKLLAVLSGMVEGVIAVDADEKIIHLNDAARRMTGIGEEFEGASIWEATRLQEISKLIRSTLESGADRVGRIEFPGAAGDTIIELHSSPLRDGQGAVVGAVVVMHDVSEIHRAERVRRDFIANASHELKTPITAMRGLIETVLDDGEMAEEEKARFLRKARDQALRLSALVSDLLTISRLEASEEPLEKEEVDLRRLIRTEVEATGPYADERKIELTMESPPEEVVVIGDEGSLGQLMINLLNNAVNYNREGGSIMVRLRTENGMAVIEVEDTGIGIAPAHRERIFERFYRVDKARSRKLGGTGLGLSIVKHIVLAHGGEVSVESTPGKGSVFKVSLPLASASA